MSDLPTLRARVEAAQALAAKATPGPWHSAGDCQTGGLDYVHVEVPIQPEQNVSEAILATIKRYGAHKAEAAGNAVLMAAAPDLVTLATDLLALAEAQAIATGGLMTEINRLRDTCLLMRESHQHVAQQRDEARAELDAIRAALGNGADEAAWPPGLTMAEAVGRLRGERETVVAFLRDWAADKTCGLKSSSRALLLSAATAVHDGDHRPSLPDLCMADVGPCRNLDGNVSGRTLCPLPAGHEGPHAEVLAGNDGEDDGA